ncbi:uncharacterized protein LOC131255543 isoform X2 [Magnolia sinica]|uniref:uncharacterized protein LOC131255543 isoform X2 n=1 Tax=Magnolia sinica TaxID=86752 RepID=UPI002658CD00|nr:uncharacterized protein LOC131255543 isoform X2 [Magnolia sinica]
MMMEMQICCLSSDPWSMSASFEMQSASVKFCVTRTLILPYVVSDTSGAWTLVSGWGFRFKLHQNQAHGESQEHSMLYPKVLTSLSKC